MMELVANYYAKDLKNLSKDILNSLNNNVGGYVVLHNVRVFSRALQDPTYRSLSLNAKYLIADGYPVSFLSNFCFDRQVTHIRGLDLFNQVLSDFSVMKPDGKILCIVSTVKIAESLKQTITVRYPNLKNINCIEAPWGQPIEIYEDIKQIIEDYRPELIWVCLGAPKQDQISQLIFNEYPTGFSIGVGVVAEYFTGSLPVAPEFWVKYRLEWLYRIFIQPKRTINFFGPIIRYTAFFVFCALSRLVNGKR